MQPVRASVSSKLPTYLGTMLFFRDSVVGAHIFLISMNIARSEMFAYVFENK